MRLNMDKLWYGRSLICWFLWPLSLIYQLIVSFRRFFLLTFCQHSFAVPIIVVGNLTVGGVGKTPLVIALVKALQEKGLRVGVVSRGYGAKITTFPHVIDAHDSASQVGDEPLLIARKCMCPVVIAPNRSDAVRYLIEKHQSQIIISDDGLQHYKMGRAIEIVVIDGARGFGNGMCLPAGPLRESCRRLKGVDFIVVNGGQWPKAYPMELIPGPLRHLKTGKKVDYSSLTTPIAAVAAIGNPQRFFYTLTSLGVNFQAHPFPDHYVFQEMDLPKDVKNIVMTEKDAVKCLSFAKDCWYVLPVNAELPAEFWHALWSHEQLKGYFQI